MNEKIYFKKRRDLGEIITDTFKFIRAEWRQLGGMILRIAGPALLIMVISASIYTQSTLGAVGTLDIYDANSGIFTGVVIISILVLLVSAIAYFGLLYGTVLNYIKSYEANNGVVNQDEVRNGVKENFGSLIGLGFLIGIMTIIGTMLCVFPGIYVGVVLGTAYAIHIFQKRDVTDTISYSFQFIKGEWWITFATYIVMYILYSFVNLIFQIPTLMYTMVKTFGAMDTITGDPSLNFSWVYTALNAISLIAQYLLQAILVISTAFVYYNLNEKKNFTGTLEKIESIGNVPPSNV